MLFDFLSMNKYFFIITLLMLSCDDPQYNDLLPDTPVDVTINLNIPSYNGLQIPGNWAYTPDSSGFGLKGIFIYNKNGLFLAYERACPHLALSECSVMSFDGTLLKCPCDDSTFNIFSGGVSESGVPYRAREYHVEIIGANSLKITSF
jgi:nitrite reductase/ring-hydroxylating ferredoxin subunit